jgi:predicted transcriptional regulator
MPIQGIEWLISFPILIIIIYVVYKVLVLKYQGSRRLDEITSHILRFIMFRGKSSIADIVAYTNVPLENVNRVVERLFKHGLVDVIEEGGVRYVIPRSGASSINRSSHGVGLAAGGQPTGQFVICPRCGHGNKPGSRYCTECGSRLED